MVEGEYLFGRLLINSAGGVFPMAGCRNEAADFSETIRRHIIVHGFIFARMNLKGFMPDTNIAITSDVFVESLPRRVM